MSSSNFSTRRPPIDPEEVFKIADDMVAAGRQVTALAVQDMLGGGSLRTVYKHLHEWEKRRKETPVVATSIDVPELVQSRFAAALADTWRLVGTEAAKEVSAIKKKAETEVADLQTKFDGALEGMQAYEEQLEQATATIEDLRSQVASLEQQNKELSHENTALKATSDQLAKQVKNQQAQFEQLHTSHEKDRHAHERDRQAHKEQLDKLMQEHSNAQNKSAEQIEKLRAEKESLHEKYEHAERERQGTAIKLDAAEKQAAVAEQSRDHANAEREKSAQLAAELKGQLEAQNAQIDRLVAEAKHQNQ